MNELRPLRLLLLAILVSCMAVFLACSEVSEQPPPPTGGGGAAGTGGTGGGGTSTGTATGTGTGTGPGGAGGMAGGGGAGGSACAGGEGGAMSGLVAEYLFSGNANDTSGNGHHGTVLGPVLTTDMDGNPDSAYEFDGLDDEIYVAPAPALNLGAATSSLTIEAWVYPTATKSQVIVRKGQTINGPNAAPYDVGLSGTGDVVGTVVWAAGSDQVRKIGYSLNTWTHVAMTWDGNTVQLYVNARLEDSLSFNGVLNTNSDPLLIGTRLQLSADTFQGKLDEIRLFETARSQCQICADAGITGTPECP